MSPFIVGILGIVALFLLFASGMRIGSALALVGFAGYSYLTSLDGALGMLSVCTYSTIASYPMSVIPLFLLMGQFVLFSGIGQEIFHAAYRWIGHLPGGLAIATVTACAAFAAISGSSTATAVTIGAVSFPEMRRYKYSTSFATAVIAAGGTLGILIPPSIILIFYGIFTEQSIGRLFLAGFFPGFLLAGLFMLTIYISARVNPHLAPPGPRTNFREKLVVLKGVWVVLVLFLLVIGGIYAEFFTPVEAGGVGAFAAFLIALSKRQLSLKKLTASLLETGRATAMMFLIVIGAMFFSRFLAASNLPVDLANFIVMLGLPKYITLSIIIFLTLVLGCFMTALPIIILTVPIFFPMILSLGFDPIWFGVILTILIEAGLITPPLGMNVFVVSGVAKVPVVTVFRGISPFLLAMVVCIVILLAFPQIALFLPNLLK